MIIDVISIQWKDDDQPCLWQKYDWKKIECTNMLVLVSRKIDAIYDHMFFFPSWIVRGTFPSLVVYAKNCYGKRWAIWVVWKSTVIPIYIPIYILHIVQEQPPLLLFFLFKRTTTSSSFIGTADWTDTCSSYIESFMIFFSNLGVLLIFTL